MAPGAIESKAEVPSAPNSKTERAPACESPTRVAVRIDPDHMKGLRPFRYDPPLDRSASTTPQPTTAPRTNGASQDAQYGTGSAASQAQQPQAPQTTSASQDAQHATTSASTVATGSAATHMQQTTSPRQMEAITLAHRLLPMLPRGRFVVCLRTEPGHPPYTHELRRMIHEEVARHRAYNDRCFYLLLPDEYDKIDTEILRKFPGPVGRG